LIIPFFHKSFPFLFTIFNLHTKKIKSNIITNLVKILRLINERIDYNEIKLKPLQKGAFD
jgi:hypothetical protein